MNFKRRIAQNQKREAYASSDEIVASIELLCRTTLSAYKQNPLGDEYKPGFNQIAKISSLTAEFGRALEIAGLEVQSLSSYLREIKASCSGVEGD